ncbi:unnamed protein product [Urochloa humidicola]
MPSLFRRVPVAVLQFGPRLGSAHGLSPAMAGAVLQSGPRLGPAHGLSPAMASRFGTHSKGEHTPFEKLLEETLQSIKLMQKENLNDKRILQKELTEFDKETRCELEKLTRSIKVLRGVGNACLAAAISIPLFLMFGSKNEV